MTKKKSNHLILHYMSHVRINIIYIEIYKNYMYYYLYKIYFII